MKQLFTFLFFVIASTLICATIFAQAPNAVPYQGVARNAAGNILASQPIRLRVSVHDITANGTVVFSETHSATTNALGLFNVNIGAGTAITSTLANVNWGSGAKFIQVEMDATGGTNYIDMGTTQLMSVPYALYAAKAANLPNGTADGNTLRWNGTAWITDNTVTNKGTNLGVGTASPSASAILDVSSTSKGFLMPRMTTAQRDAIASPATGLQVYNLDDKCTDLYDGSTWIKTCGMKATVIIDPGHATTNSWTQKTNFGGSARYLTVGFSIGSNGYIGTGYDGSYKNDFWEYDPASNTWTQKANFGGSARWAAVGFSIGNKGYIGTGDDGSDKNDFWEYDPASNTWVQKANFGGSARWVAVGFSIGSKGYIGTGNGSSYKNDFWEYNPADNSWVQKANFGGSARYGAVGFSIGSKGYIGTGYDVTYKNDFWEYDPASNTWAQKVNFGGSARYLPVGFSIGNKGYIGTGFDGSSKNNFWEYDVAGNVWTQKANFGGSARYGAVAFSIGSKGYIGTGYDVSYKNDFWEYMDNNITGYVYNSNITPNNSVSDGSWTLSTDGTVYNANTGNIGIGTDAPATSAQLEINSTSKGFLMPRMTTAQRNAISSPAIGLQIFNLDDQCIDIYDGSNWIKSCGLKVTGIITDTGHITTNSWKRKANFVSAPRILGIGVSTDSKGYMGLGSGLNDFWEYDPNTNLWTQKANYPGAGTELNAGFSISNKIYIGTGSNTNGVTSFKDFWEFNPSLNTWTSKANFGGTIRLGAVGFSIGTKGYIGIGSEGYGTTLKDDFWEYNPSNNSWTKKSYFRGGGRWGAAGFSIGNKAYVGTGSNTGIGGELVDFWEYDPSVTDTSLAWTRKADYPSPGAFLGIGFNISGKGYISRGYNGNAFNQYNPSTNTWVSKTAFPGYTIGPTGFAIGNKGYIKESGADFWEYMDDNVTGSAYSSAIPASGNLISDGAWTVTNTTVYNANSGNIGIGTTTPASKLDIEGAVSIGATYAGTTAAPTNGAIIEGKVGIGTATPASKLDIEGGISIGSTYSGTTAAPTNGVIIEGNVGIGTTNPSTAKLVISGSAGSQGIDLSSSDMYANLRVLQNTRSAIDKDMYIGYQSGTTSSLHLYSNNGETVTVANGSLGIGQTSPQAPLHITGTGITTPGVARSYFALNSGLISNTSSSGNILVRADGWFWANNGGYVATSDKRIKNILGLTDNKKDLETLSQIKITDYKYIDEVSNGSGLQKKLIAQELKEIYPTAVNQNEGVIPNVYETAKAVEIGSNSTIITTNKIHGFRTGDMVKLVLSKGGEKMFVVTVLDEHRFRVDEKISDQVFVYGKNVKDLMNVDYDAVSMLNVSATQELYRMINELKAENDKLKAANEKLQIDNDKKAAATNERIKILEDKLITILGTNANK